MKSADTILILKNIFKLIQTAIIPIHIVAFQFVNQFIVDVFK